MRTFSERLVDGCYLNLTVINDLCEEGIPLTG